MGAFGIGIISNLATQLLLFVLKYLRLGSPYFDLDFVPTEIALDETPVSVRSYTYGDFVIRGRTHELKQGMELSITLPSHVTTLLVAAWGVIMGPNRFMGSLTDSGKIGEVRFYNGKGRRLRIVDVRLPTGSVAADLKLADANPVISGDPPPVLIAQAGFLARIKARYSPLARNLWDYANVWISDIEVPGGTRRVTFAADQGSMNIVHLRAIRRFRPFEALHMRRLQNMREEIAFDVASWDAEREGRENRMSAYVAEAENLLASGSNQEAVSRFVAAAHEALTLAYLPGSDAKRGAYLQSAGSNFIRCAEAARAGEDVFLTAKYYVHGLMALEQAGEGGQEDMVEKAISSLDQLEAHYRAQPLVNPDHLIRTWYQAGVLCLEAARSSKRRNFYYERAFGYYVNRVVKATMERVEPSYRELRFAQERLIILRSEYHRLGIVKNELLPIIDERLKAVQDKMKTPW